MACWERGRKRHSGPSPLVLNEKQVKLCHRCVRKPGCGKPSTRSVPAGVFAKRVTEACLTGFPTAELWTFCEGPARPAHPRLPGTRRRVTAKDPPDGRTPLGLDPQAPERVSAGPRNLPPMMVGTSRQSGPRTAVPAVPAALESSNSSPVSKGSKAQGCLCTAGCSLSAWVSLCLTREGALVEVRGRL